MDEKMQGYNSHELIYDEDIDISEESIDELNNALHELYNHKQIDPELERLREERTQAALKPITEPQNGTRYTEPYMMPIAVEANSGIPGVVCTCGWSKRSFSIKVLQIAAWKHFDKTGHRRMP